MVGFISIIIDETPRFNKGMGWNRMNIIFHNFEPLIFMQSLSVG